MGLETILTYIITIAGSSAFSLFIKTYFDKRKADNEDKKVEKDEKEVDNKFLLESLKITVDLITKQRDEAYDRMEKMQDRIINMELEIMGMKMVMGHDPFPRWIVDNNDRYLFVNSTFEKEFLSPKGLQSKDIIGKTHADIWPKNIVEAFKKIDTKALKSTKSLAKMDINMNIGNHANVTIYKMPLRINDVVVGFIGYSLDTSD